MWFGFLLSFCQTAKNIFSTVMVYMPAVAQCGLRLPGCCVSFGFSALKSETADMRICLINCMWAGKATMKKHDTVLSW